MANQCNMLNENEMKQRPRVGKEQRPRKSNYLFPLFIFILLALNEKGCSVDEYSNYSNNDGLVKCHKEKDKVEGASNFFPKKAQTVNRKISILPLLE